MRARVQAAVRSARQIQSFAAGSGSMRRDIDALRAQLGGVEARSVRQLAPDRLPDAEFRVFSQFGEDGIIQFLVQHVVIENEVFVEFGVQDYSESNTRFLLVHDNWRGLILDGDDAHVTMTRAAGLDWQYGLDAVTRFIDRSNVNDVIRGAGVKGDIGLLSVDIDGNDYWVLEQIDVVSARILVVEYNSTWGSAAAVTIPYAPAFRRGQVTPTLYYGASLAALARLAGERGYALVGANRAGNNAFFVRRDVLGELPERSVAGVYRPSRFRESVDASEQRTYVSDHRARLSLMADLPLWDLDAEKTVSVRERFGF